MVTKIAPNTGKNTYLNNKFVDFNEVINDRLSFLTESLIIVGFIITSFFLLKELVNWVDFVFNRCNLKKLDIVPLANFRDYCQR